MTAEPMNAPPRPGVRDVMVTVPMGLWVRWLAEGDLPGDPPAESGTWDFTAGTHQPLETGPGSRVYVVAFGLLRGYAPLVRTEPVEGRVSFVREGGAVACTLRDTFGRPEKVKGFQGWRYTTFDRARLVPLPTWATEGLPRREAALVENLLVMRRDPARRADLRRRALSGAGLFG